MEFRIEDPTFFSIRDVESKVATPEGVRGGGHSTGTLCLWSVEASVSLTPADSGRRGSDVVLSNE